MYDYKRAPFVASVTTRVSKMILIVAILYWRNIVCLRTLVYLYISIRLFFGKYSKKQEKHFQGFHPHIHLFRAEHPQDQACTDDACRVTEIDDESSRRFCWTCTSVRGNSSGRDSVKGKGISIFKF